MLHRHKYKQLHPGPYESHPCHQIFHIRKIQHSPEARQFHGPAFSGGRYRKKANPLHGGKFQMPCCHLPRLAYFLQRLHNSKAAVPVPPQRPASDEPPAVPRHCTSGGESPRSGCTSKSAGTAHTPLPEKQRFRPRSHTWCPAHQTSDIKVRQLRCWSDGYPYPSSGKSSRPESAH